MSTRLANCIFLVGLFLVGGYFLYESDVIVSTNPAGGVGQVQFPVTLAVLLMVLCVVECGRTLLGKSTAREERLEIPNAAKLAMTVLLTGAYFLLWSWIGYFYPLTAVFFLVLVLIYQERPSLRSAAIAAIVSVLFAALLYLVFGVAFGVRMG